jgi:mono/diheme cytochrome c family protein
MLFPVILCMKNNKYSILYCSFSLLLGLVWSTQAQGPVERGAYVFRASGGCSCHTDIERDGDFMAGGRGIATPFGTIYATNITPDKETGIGTWSEADFIRSMTEGVAPDGSHYYPVFPYTSFTRMTARDLSDLKAYLFSLPPIKKENLANDLAPPFSWRFTLGFWKLLHFARGPFATNPEQSDEWNRGAYLVEALAHCGECHTPRTATGGLQENLAYAGSAEGPEGELAPNITPDKETGIGTWSSADITWYLQNGFEPEGDSAQGLMWELIEHGYQHLSEDDLAAMAVYLRGLEPIEHDVGGD